MWSTCSRCERIVVAACAFALACGRNEPRLASTALRVCADPNNLPFSNRAREGLEDRLADLIAHELGAEVQYAWLPQRRAFIRNTLAAGKCDVVLGVPAGFERTANTRPYYRSSYVFVTRADRKLALHTFDDPALRDLRIGLHAIGDDYSNVPPAMALARRGITSSIVGYPIYGDYSKPNPPAALIDAVAHGDIDVAIAWGPLAGYFARSSSVPLTVTPIDSTDPGTTFAIAIGVRRGDVELRDRLDHILERDRVQIAALLDRFGVPRVEVR